MYSRLFFALNGVLENGKCVLEFLDFFKKEFQHWSDKTGKIQCFLGQ